ncbi:MFS transporter [Occallatibacter savannae]|uniref:MFS transporter n=1 Tax=Occallatibacter savannae TaxID=1002691 RepID=UPI000D693B69|nr:MFS transporter [Occallatibacter savannae]
MNRTGSTSDNGTTEWWIISGLCGFAVSSYLARANISVASESMRNALHLNQVQMGEIFSSFLAGYALFQIAGGAIGDRFGPRITLGISALLWSATSVTTGLVPRLFASSTASILIAFCAVRLLLGAAEATTFPVGNLAIRMRLNPSQHARGTSVMFLGTCIASAATGPLVSYLNTRFGWQAVFYLTAAPPFVLGCGWLLLAPGDNPQPSSRTSADPAARLEVLKILSRRNTVLLVMSYISEGYVLFLFVFWMYTYLVERRGFSLMNAGWLSAAPWLTALVLTPLGGIACDRVSRRSGKAYGARVVIATGYVASGVFLYVAAYSRSQGLCLFGLCASIASLMAAEPGFWSFAAHVSGDHVGLVSGVMNTAGIVGGIASTLLVPILVRSLDWGIALASGTAMALFCAAVWLFIGEV